MRRKVDNAERMFLTQCAYCGEDILYYEDSNKGRVFFDPFDRVPEGGRHSDTCTSSDNPYISDRNPTFLRSQGLIVENEVGHIIARQVACVSPDQVSKNVSYVIFEEDEQKSREAILNNPTAFAAGVDPDFTDFKIGRIIPATPEALMKIRPLEPPENRKAFLAILNFIRGDHEGLLEKVSKIVRLKQLIQESKTPQKESDSQEQQESSVMRLMFYWRRGIKDLFEYALDAAQKISTGTPWVLFCDQYSFFYKTNIIDRQFKHLGPRYAIFFEALKEVFESKSIPDEIVKDDYYRIFTRKREEILKFVNGQLIDLDHRSRQDYFECAVLAAILYWRKKISWDDFKTYVLSKQKILRNKTETHAINLLCHIAVMDAHAHTHDFPQLCTLTNNFLDNLGLRPLTQNEILQKLDNWLLRLDPYDEIRNIRKQGDISSAVTLIRDHHYNNLAAALDVLWPEAKREVYMKAVCGIEEEVLKQKPDSPTSALQSICKISKQRGLVDELGFPLPNTLAPFPRLLECLELDLKDLPTSFPHVTQSNLRARQAIRAGTFNRKDSWCEVISVGGSQIGRSCWVVKTHAATVILDFGIDPLSGQVPMWCPELEDADAVLISHLHGDHIGGIFHLVEGLNFQGPIYADILNSKFADLVLKDILVNQERGEYEDSDTPKEMRAEWNIRVENILQQFAFVPKDNS